MQRTLASLVLLLNLAPAAFAGGPRYALQVAGLACPFCAYGVEKALSRVDGVTDVQVEIRNGRIVVTLGEGAELTEERARQAVKDAGFTPGKFEQLGKTRE
ncbi:MAG: heavy-metal-associated domain-containing protein [Gammaproteobacteria bacterium]|nr:heavy-metal-associated domain-containing protein [Gammaproteobacteria bacterium]